LLILYIARKPKQFQRALDRLSAACNLLSYFTLPAAEGDEMPSVKFNVSRFAVHGTHSPKRGVSKISEAGSINRLA
jgi:hypothetical protein